MAAAFTEEMGGRTTEQEIRLHILTVNVNGLITNGKKLLEQLQRLESANRAVDVVFLAETHVKDTRAWRMFMKDWKILFTSYDSRTQGCYKSKRKISKGTAILLKRENCFTDVKKSIDKSGRYVIVHCKISGRSCTFVSVYHRSDERGLLKQLSKEINAPSTDILVVGGDFNTALDKVKDTTSTCKNRNHKAIRIELQHFLDKHGLIDAWREKNPDKREYTYEYKDKGEDYYNRLDYLFINADKWELVQDCRINGDIIADHRSVSLDLKTPKLKILSCTVHDLPRDEDLAELCPDIILLTKGQAEDVDYITRLKEEEEREEKKWKVLWSRHSNAAILVAERQRGILILFTVYHEDYVILHCIVLGMLHTFVSVCRPTEEILQDMLRKIMSSYSRSRVIGGDFSTSEQRIVELMRTNEFNIPEGGSTQLRYLIHAQVGRAYEIEEQISGRPYSSLILHLPEMKPKDVDNIIQSLGQLKIHH